MTTTTTTTTTSSTLPTVTIANTDLNHEETGLAPLENKKKFRLQCKSIFITFPQTETTPEIALERLLANPKTHNCQVVIAQENHQDGNKHLHLYVEFPKSTNIRDKAYFDFICNKHGNLQKVKCKEAVLAYITKENRWISHEIDVPTVLQAWKVKGEKKRKREKQTKSHKIYEYLKGGSTYQDLLKNDELGSFLVLHSQKVQRLAHEFQKLQEKEKRNAEKPKYLHFVLNDMEYDMLANLPFKSKQFWIWGPPNVGKSTFIMKMEQAGLHGYQIPTNGDFARWDDDHWDFAYIDEFKGQLTIQFLNEFLQGSKMYLNGKYVVGGTVKNKNLPVFILSNYLPEEVYHKKSSRDLEPLLARLKVIKLESFNDYEIITTPTFDTNGSPLHVNDLYCDEDMITTS